MKRVATYTIVFGLCLFLMGVSMTKAADDEFPAPVEFKSTDMKDLGNFHGSAPGDEQQGWNYWGAREPVVSPG